MTLLIFDFDGTIVDSKQAYYQGMEKALSEYGFSKRSIDDAIDVGLSLSETLKKLGFSMIFRWILKRKIMKRVLAQTSQIKKCRDVDGLRSLDGEKIIISNSLSEFIIPVLKHLKLRKEFSEIYGSESFSDKAVFIKNYLTKNKINKKECFYIGDRVIDIKTARECKIKSIIISNKCSWDSKKEILRAKPDFIIKEIKEIKNIL